MFITTAGTPAGYGYFEMETVADKNIMPDIVAYAKNKDPNLTSMMVGTMTIMVDGDNKVSINDRVPVLVTKDISLSFDARGVYSVVFDESGTRFNVAFSY